MSMQKRIENEITRRINAAQIDVEIDRSWANVATWYLIKSDGVTPYDQFRTQFNGGYWQCTGFNGQPKQGPESGCYIEYANTIRWLDRHFDRLIRTTLKNRR